MLPFELITLFKSSELENLVCGSPDIDVELLKEKTIYLGDVRETDKHIVIFWEVLREFSAEDKRSFLQFVWGRSRLPSSRISFGKDAFRISDHALSLHSRYRVDHYFPVAHTCFFHVRETLLSFR
jgi:hypothetical protein